MNDNSFEPDDATLNSKLYAAEAPAGIHANQVMIATAIYTRYSESFHSALKSATLKTAILVTVTVLRISTYTHAHQEQQRTQQTN
jgi:hypothetical protein